ncbi:hypothetical protein [Patulibacter defluvii]|uniref:hypothetical protein n=1 Tax=Patulibacter defluvii TaxID=3095358 RepID=UPI002A752670|nr:hypothetical protein [Patulibacter sp. DM4]
MRLTDLLGARVETRSGDPLGHVLDVRARREDDRFHVEGLVTGRSGVRARLGFRAARRPEPLHLRDVVAWDDVVEVRPGLVVVADGADRRARGDG